MSQENYTSDLLGLEGVEIEEFWESDSEIRDCRKMLRNWRPYILNAFDIPLSNGFTEGCNNAIKTLKRLAFGFRNFHSFRARILLSLLPHPNI